MGSIEVSNEEKQLSNGLHRSATSFHGSVQFDLGEVSHPSFGKVDIKSEFPRLKPRFERPLVSDGDLKSLKCKLMKWVREYFDTSVNEKGFEELASAAVLFTVYVNPFTKLFSKEMDIIIMMYFWLWYNDDEIEDSIEKGIPFKSLKMGTDQLRDVLLGKYDTGELKFKEVPGYKCFGPLFNSLKNLHQICMDALPNYQQRVGPSRYFLQRYFEAQRWFSVDRIDERYSEEAFRTWRKIVAYFDGIAEIVALVEGVTLPKEIQRSPSFGKILDIANSFGGFVNDLLGMKKELANGQRDNLIVFKVLSKKIPLQTAVEQVCKMMETELTDFLLMKSVVLQEFDYEPNLVRYIDIIESLIDGHNRIYPQSTRHRTAGCIKLVRFHCKA